MNRTKTIVTDSNPYREQRYEEPRGPMGTLLYCYLPAFLLFIGLRMLMLKSGYTIIDFGVVDEHLRDVLRLLLNYYLVYFG